MTVSRISAVEWLSARQVVGGEATDFTPWLAENLNLMQDALGLDELILKEVEADVQGKSLDILAQGVDQFGHEFPVIIENQYGTTDHRHLGQLVTYLAQYGPGYAVWVVEDSHPALVTALDFLNRTSPEDVNYYMVRVRFTHGPEYTHQVDFQVLVQPDYAAKPRRASRSKGSKLNEEKIAYMGEILGRVKQPLADAGYRSVRMHTYGSYIEMRLPIPVLDAWDARVKIFANKDEATVRLYVVNQDLDHAHNAAAIEVIKDRYAESWQSKLPGEVLEWNGGPETAIGDFVRVARSGLGYTDGGAADAADWATGVAAAWLEDMLADPIDDLEDPVAALITYAEDADTDG